MTATTTPPLAIPWHRLFGLIADDMLQPVLHLPCEVRLEEDLSKQQHYLDVLIIRQTPLPDQPSLPDGLRLTCPHRLLSCKFHQEPFHQTCSFLPKQEQS